MSWTNERVEVMTRLWLEGRSASQIAAELGPGVTRNAVIGKVHRLGLAGRAKPVAAPPRVKAKPSPAAPQAAPDGMAEAEPSPVPPVPVRLERDAEVGLPATERVTIMELRESSCRWPMGDPSQVEFRFCGSRTAVGAGPYCATHARLAFQPTHERRRDRVDRYARIA